MKIFTLKGMMCTVALLALTANAQLRWNPSDWKCPDVEKGAEYVVDPENKTLQWHPYSHKTDDLSVARGDIRLEADVVLSSSEPYLVYYMTLDGASISYRDWKYQVMHQEKKATSCTPNADGGFDYVWEETANSFNDQNKEFFNSTAVVEKFKMLNSNSYYNISDKAEVEDAAGYDVFVLDMNMFNAENFFSAGDEVSLPFIPKEVIVSGEGTIDAIRVRSWLSNVCIAAQLASKNPKDATFTLHYVATAEDPNDVLDLIETYKAGDGGKEVRDGEEGAVKGLHNNSSIAVYQNADGEVIAPAATRLVAYSVAGVQVADVQASSLTLPAGIYVVRAFNNTAAATVKVRVK